MSLKMDPILSNFCFSEQIYWQIYLDSTRTQGTHLIPTKRAGKKSHLHFIYTPYPKKEKLLTRIPHPTRRRLRHNASLGDFKQHRTAPGLTHDYCTLNLLSAHIWELLFVVLLLPRLLHRFNFVLRHQVYAASAPSCTSQS